MSNENEAAKAEEALAASLSSTRVAARGLPSVSRFLDLTFPPPATTRPSPSGRRHLIPFPTPHHYSSPVRLSPLGMVVDSLDGERIGEERPDGSLPCVSLVPVAGRALRRRLLQRQAGAYNLGSGMMGRLWMDGEDFFRDRGEAREAAVEARSGRAWGNAA
jgi:hypothetical protein